MSFCDSRGAQVHPDHLRVPAPLPLTAALRMARHVAHDEGLPEDERVTIVMMLMAAAIDDEVDAWASA